MRNAGQGVSARTHYGPMIGFNLGNLGEIEEEAKAFYGRMHDVT
jgi:hypothetical protein